MFQTVAINIRPDDLESLAFLTGLVQFFQRNRIRPILPGYGIILNDRNLAKLAVDNGDFVEKPDLVVVIGGDGSFLRTARMFSHRRVPIFGINKGQLGFLTEFRPEEAIDHLARAITGDFTVSQRIMLRATLVRHGEEEARMLFLNDAVISKGALSRPIKLNLEINGSFLNRYSGDGIIISTATGSTAYSLSAGGPIISPLIDCVYTINPICPHMLAIRPMIVPLESELKVTILSDFENLLLTIDGQEAIRIRRGDEIAFSASESGVSLITHPDRSYYDILREKLGWGKI